MHMMACYSSVAGDNFLRQFWEIEEGPLGMALSMEERAVIQYFNVNHYCTLEGSPYPSKLIQGQLESQRLRPFVVSSHWRDCPLERVASQSSTLRCKSNSRRGSY